MTFLNAMFLTALPLVAVPIVLHLLRRRQRQVVSWGAMQFLTDAVSDGRRFDRVEEWLLLALRTTVLLALVLALARPLVRGLSPQTAVVEDVVVVIDDSLSTDRSMPGGQVSDAIRNRVRQFVEERGGGEGVRLMLAAEGPRWLVEQPIPADAAGKRQLLAAVDGLKPTRGAANFLNCLRLASSLEAGEEGTVRRVVIFTDGQAKGWAVESRGVWARLRSAIEQSKRNIRCEVVAVDVPPAVGANLSIDRVLSSRQVAGEGEMVTFTAQITNTGTADAPPSTVVWSIDGKRQGETDVPQVGARQTTKVQWRWSFERRGVCDVSATVDSADLLALDNDAGVVIDIVEAVPVLVLVPEAGLETEENSFLAAALSYDADKKDKDKEKQNGNVKSEWSSLYHPTFIHFSEAEKETIAHYHAVIVSSLGELSPAAVEKLSAYVREGGGLWLMLGSQIDRDEFNRRWHSNGTGLCPVPLSSLVRPADRDSAEAAIHPPAGDHPTTAVIADTDRLDIDRVRLRRYHSFIRQPGQELTPLLESGLGAPLALLHHVGKGRVIVQAYPLRTDWTDLAISKSFVVMVQDWLAYLTQPAATRFNLAAREPFIYQRESGTEEEQAELTLPDGLKIAVKPIDRGDGLVYRVAATGLPGRYRLRIPAGKESRELPFRVSRSAAESDLTPLGSDDKAMLLDTAGVRFDGPGDLSEAAPPAVARLEPAWWPLLIAMVCLMVAESLLATRVSRGRFGSVIAAATT